MRRFSYCLIVTLLITPFTGEGGRLWAGPLEECVPRALHSVRFGAAFVVTGGSGVIFEQVVGNPATVHLSGDCAVLRMDVSGTSGSFAVEAIAVLGPGAAGPGVCTEGGTMAEGKLRLARRRRWSTD